MRAGRSTVLAACVLMARVGLAAGAAGGATDSGNEVHRLQLAFSRGEPTCLTLRALRVPQVVGQALDARLGGSRPPKAALMGGGRVPSVGWVDEFGTADFTLVSAVAVDGKNIYAYGDTTGELPDQTSAGGLDVFLRKYDHKGRLLWTRQFGTAGDDSSFGANTLAVEDGAIYVAGFVSDALPGQTYAGGEGDAFLRKYDAHGNEVWTRQFGTDTFDDIHGVALEDDHVYVAGSTGATLPGQTYAGGIEDGFLRKYDEDGNEVWTRQFGTEGDDHPIVAAAEDDGVFVGGLTDGTFPGQTSAGFYDAFIRRYDEKGRLKWTRQFGTEGFDEIWGIAADGRAVYVAGDTEGTLPGQTGAGDLDVFVRKYSSRGRERWTRQFGSPAFDIPGMPAVDEGTVYIPGLTSGVLPGQASFGLDDAFVRTYDARGNLGFTVQFGSEGFDSANGIALDDDDVAFVGGYTGGRLFGRDFSGGLVDGFVLQLRVDDEHDDDEHDDHDG